MKPSKSIYFNHHMYDVRHIGCYIANCDMIKCMVKRFSKVFSKVFSEVKRFTKGVTSLALDLLLVGVRPLYRMVRVGELTI